MVKLHGRIKRNVGSKRRALRSSVHHLLEVGTLESIRNAKQVTAEHLKYQWMYYAELARQRSLIKESIAQALTQTCISYHIKNWQRAVKYKYGLHPFSTMGSLVYIGGRFNTGVGVNQEVPSFPALYLAQDKDTALQEHLGQQACVSGFNLNPHEAAIDATNWRLCEMSAKEVIG
ncbi:MAG TPA: RES family NAD+ phosphorylase [Gammaproteobacteria bacterium]|nr:RES family NAD+ phosphorylase [Gammaproteobacteria bacterium]